VTLGEFKAFVRASGHKVESGSWCNWDSGKFAENERQPVQCVSWNDAVAYTQWLSAQTGQTYRLPSEAEWEYAARAGTTTPFSTGQCIGTDQANYDGNYPYQNCPKGEYRQQTVAVGSFAANAFGLYDMHGNVWEWTCSAYTGKYDGNESSCKNNANTYVLRGGAWNGLAHFLRAAYRSRYSPDVRYGNLGFRVVSQ
jgi:formylglycine-generating enzyme required for sulfatase activity